jgi:hypothetical protein
MTFSIPNHCSIPTWTNRHLEPCRKDHHKGPETARSHRVRKNAAHPFSRNRSTETTLSGATGDLSNATGNTGNVQTAARTDVTVTNQIKSEITITTADGDTVTLNTASLFEASYTAYNQSGEINGSPYNISASSASVSVSKEFSLSIEGELDREEIRDIAKAIREVNKIMRRLLSGDTGHALKRASKLYRLDSLAGIEATMETGKSVSVTERVARSAVESPASTETPPPETAGEETASVEAASEEEIPAKAA